MRRNRQGSSLPPTEQCLQRRSHCSPAVREPRRVPQASQYDEEEGFAVEVGAVHYTQRRLIVGQAATYHHETANERAPGSIP